MQDREVSKSCEHHREGADSEDGHFFPVTSLCKKEQLSIVHATSNYPASSTCHTTLSSWSLLSDVGREQGMKIRKKVS